MRNIIAELEAIGELLGENSEAAQRQLEAFKAMHKPIKNKFISAKTDLLTLVAASVFNKYEQQQIDDTKLLKYFEGEEKYEEAAQLLLAKARHYFMNSKLGEGENLLHYIRDRFLGKTSLRSEIVYYTRVTFVHARRFEHDEVLKVSMQALEKLNCMEQKSIWYYSIYTIFCTNIAESYHSNSDFDKAWPYLQQSLEIAETQNIPVYNKYNVYSFFGFHFDYKNEWQQAALWFEKAIALLLDSPGHEYYLLQSYIAAARQYAMLFNHTPVKNKKLRESYIIKQEEFFAQVNGRIKPGEQGGVYVVLMTGLAELEYQRKNYERAVSFLNKALPVYTERGHHKGIIDCHNLAHQIYYAWGKETNDVSKVLQAYDFLKTGSDMVVTQAKQTNLQKLEAVEAKNQLRQKQLSEQLMRQQIESMNKEMRLSAINLQEKIILLDDLKEYVHSLKKKEFEKRQFILAISQKIGAIKITEEDKALLQQKMDTGNVDFSKIVSEKYPALSAHEVRSCALFKTGLTNGELAQLYGLSKRAYEQLRYRIKQKMKLGSGDDLVKHLTALSSASSIPGQV